MATIIKVDSPGQLHELHLSPLYFTREPHLSPLYLTRGLLGDLPGFHRFLPIFPTFLGDYYFQVYVPNIS